MKKTLIKGKNIPHLCVICGRRGEYNYNSQTTCEYCYIHFKNMIDIERELINGGI